MIIDYAAFRFDIRLLLIIFDSAASRHFRFRLIDADFDFRW